MRTYFRRREREGEEDVWDRNDSRWSETEAVALGPPDAEEA